MRVTQHTNTQTHRLSCGFLGPSGRAPCVELIGMISTAFIRRKLNRNFHCTIKGWASDAEVCSCVQSELLLGRYAENKRVSWTSTCDIIEYYLWVNFGKEKPARLAGRNRESVLGKANTQLVDCVGRKLCFCFVFGQWSFSVQNYKFSASVTQKFEVWGQIRRIIYAVPLAPSAALLRR